MSRKPVFVNMKYNRTNSALSQYVKRITGALPFDSVTLDAVAGSAKGGFRKQFTSSMDTRRELRRKFPESEAFTISLDNRYQYPDLAVVHHMPDGSGNWVETRLMLRALKHADHIVAISDTTAGRVREKFPGKDIHVIKNGLEVHEPLERKERKGIVVSQIGGIASGNSRRLPMLRVPALLREAFPDEEITFVHVGGRDNENEQALLEACHDHGITAEFKSRVEQEYIWEAYARSDLYIYLSTVEGYSLTPMEALSMGTPCLISDIDIHREVYGDKDGIMFTGNDRISAQDILDAYHMGPSLSYRKKTLERTWDNTIGEFRDLITRLA